MRWLMTKNEEDREHNKQLNITKKNYQEQQNGTLLQDQKTTSTGVKHST